MINVTNTHRKEDTHMNKYAYEIRLEILRMANDNLWQEYQATIDRNHRTTELAGSENTTNVFESANVPTQEKIIKLAEALYSFVEQTD